jgi:DnaK suppressor protein
MIALDNCKNTPKNDYMTPAHLEFFKNRLIAWRDELVGTSNSIMNNLKEVDLRKPDPVDCGSLHAEKELNLLAGSRNARLIQQIEHALRRIEQGIYGYCEVTGEEIGLKRLEILPLTTLSIEAQEEIERSGRAYS